MSARKIKRSLLLRRYEKWLLTRDGFVLRHSFNQYRTWNQ